MLCVTVKHIYRYSLLQYSNHISYYYYIVTTNISLSPPILYYDYVDYYGFVIALESQMYRLSGEHAQWGRYFGGNCMLTF